MRPARTPVLACLFGLALIPAAARPATAQVIDFEDLKLAPESFYNGSDLAGGFVSEGAFFNNNYNPTFGSWSGWSYSNITDVTTPGFMNQYSAYNLPDGGGDASPNYGVAYNFSPGDAIIDLPDGTMPQSVRITNTTYAALSMRDGDMFARQFHGPDGTNPGDWFLLTIYGLDADGEVTGSVDFYLADYRSQDPKLNYIVSEWTAVDLTALGAATTLFFQLISTDVDPMFGMNTPAYFALDNLQLAPEQLRSIELAETLLGYQQRFPNHRRPRGGRLRKLLHLPPDCMLYGIRHAWTTRAILHGVPMKLAATLLGHEDTYMLNKHYAHVDGLVEPSRQAMLQTNGPPKPETKRGL
jgi:hypothetical protein